MILFLYLHDKKALLIALLRLYICVSKLLSLYKQEKKSDQVLYKKFYYDKKINYKHSKIKFQSFL
jgi:hypothetical protein